MSTNNTVMSSSAATGIGKIGLSYGIVISVGTMVVLTTILVVSYVCFRLRPMDSGGSSVGGTGAFDIVIAGDEEGAAATARGGRYGGIDQATLDKYPKMMYAESKLPRSKSQKDCCSICLTDYKDSDVVRVMPDCGHVFHVACIDEWLRRHPTCPMCRVVSPLPSAQASPMPTPLSEFIPLARNDSLRRP